jgi:hypothetical protein
MSITAQISEILCPEPQEPSEYSPLVLGAAERTERLLSHCEYESHLNDIRALYVLIDFLHWMRVNDYDLQFSLESVFGQFIEEAEDTDDVKLMVDLIRTLKNHGGATDGEQFARLLCEIEYAYALDKTHLARSMFVTVDKIEELFDRANTVWKITNLGPADAAQHVAFMNRVASEQLGGR